MEHRDLKVMFAKSGSGSITTRLAIPKKWANDMGLSPEEREVEVTYTDNKEIIIKKKEQK